MENMEMKTIENQLPPVEYLKKNVVNGLPVLKDATLKPEKDSILRIHRDIRV